MYIFVKIVPIYHFITTLLKIFKCVTNVKFIVCILFVLLYKIFELIL